MKKTTSDTENFSKTRVPHVTLNDSTIERMAETAAENNVSRSAVYQKACDIFLHIEDFLSTVKQMMEGIK